ncbi:MAG: ATP-binding protein [Paludibacteraceae bacterium]|nr:ATP-binding protein [Paludibacteraceae bacterium]
MADFYYRKRVADALLKDCLETAGAVLVQGPKWCGKTTTCEQQAASKVMLANPEVLAESKQMAQINMSGLLAGSSPRLFDEWQSLPVLWDSIRYEVDRRRGTGYFILTGSAVPVDPSQIQHTGTGRYAWLRMRPMSLWESGDSTGEVSLGSLFEQDGRIVSGQNSHTLDNIAHLICRGGWPDSLERSPKSALKTAYNYIDALAESDVSRVDETLRNPKRIRLLMRSVARLQGSQAPISVIRSDMLANDEQSLSEKTIASYINALEKLFVIEDMPAWSVNLRSKSAIRTSNTRYYVDPSIAVAALGITPQKLTKDLNTMGFLFETMCVRDLRVYADAIDAKVYHYRDKDELECDAVIELRDGSYGLVEVKLGGMDNIEAAQHSMLKLQKKINTDKAGEPRFRMVLTGVGNYAFTMPDGTHVVPIGCLKP